MEGDGGVVFEDSMTRARSIVVVIVMTRNRQLSQIGLSSSIGQTIVGFAVAYFLIEGLRSCFGLVFGFFDFLQGFFA